ncbi:MAG: hypothetical protein Q7T34_01730 [Candidatus Parcubacteria bacterium]|nr:hypothetical protein [Candidatus Parcubacteria bacterium]
MEKNQKVKNVRFRRPEEITDEIIKNVFASAKLVRMSVNSNDCIQYQHISFNNLSFWLPLKRVLDIMGVTPEMLRSALKPQAETVKRKFPFNLFKKLKYKIVIVELPEKVETFRELSRFTCSNYQVCRKLADILGKPIEVLREEGYNGICDHLFTVFPITKEGQVNKNQT